MADSVHNTRAPAGTREELRNSDALIAVSARHPPVILFR